MKVFAAVVVQIIGLAVLRNDPEMGGMHVVLPSVTASQVESHTAMIIFKDTDRVVRGTKTELPFYPLKAMPGYSYVKLNGERVSFIVNGINPPAATPARLPRLTRNCTLMDQLSDGYKPPAYAEAVAVVLTPYGTADACRNTNGRIDTRVRIVNTGNYRIVAGNKSITLRENAKVRIANVPTAWVEGAEARNTSHIHSGVYYHMARRASQASQTCRLQPALGVAACPLFASPVSPRRARRLAARMIRPDSPDARKSIETLMAFTTFECSNTQWP